MTVSLRDLLFTRDARRAKMTTVRFETMRKLLQQFQAKEEGALDSDETLTESEIALGRLVLPLFQDREAMSRQIAEMSKKVEALQVAVNHIPLPVLVLDPEGALLILNKEARDLFRGPAVPVAVLEKAKQFVLRPVHRERLAEFSPDGGRTRTTVRLIPGQVREKTGPTTPQLFFAVRPGTTMPLPPQKLIATFGFTPREADLAELVAQGLTNKEIAEKLRVSADTIRTHLAEAFAKSGAKNRAELVTLAVAAVFGLSPE